MRRGCYMLVLCCVGAPGGTIDPGSQAGAEVTDAQAKMLIEWG